jgi:phospholipid N-methyltransferase
MQTNVQGPSKGEQVVLFARNFFKHPKMLGSLIPSSRFLINQVLAKVDWTKARTVVEFGPGVGTFTTEILRRLRPDGALIVLETNPDFVRLLRKSYDDPRLKVEHRSAADIGRVLDEHGLKTVDCIISGIPFSTMPAQLRRKILRRSQKALGRDGAMLVYQFSDEVLPDLRNTFDSVDQDFELLNVLPARIFTCRR